jgi:hypothetical protein
MRINCSYSLVTTKKTCIKGMNLIWAWWHMPVIPAFGVAKEGGT